MCTNRFTLKGVSTAQNFHLFYLFPYYELPHVPLVGTSTIIILLSVHTRRFKVNRFVYKLTLDPPSIVICSHWEQSHITIVDKAYIYTFALSFIPFSVK